MRKLLGAALALATFVPMAAFAATFTNVQFDNGDVTISGQGGSTVNATFHVVVPANQVVENIQTDVISDNLAPVCTSVGGDLGLQEGTHDVTIAVKLPPNTGTYNLEVRGAGIFGGIRSVDCNDNQIGTATFSGALRTVDSNTNTTTSGGTSSTSFQSQIDALTASLKSLTDLFAKFVAGGVTAGGTTPAKPACPPAGDTNVVQAWLMANGYAGGFSAIGVFAPTGHWGPVTASAYAAASAACK